MGNCSVNKTNKRTERHKRGDGHEQNAEREGGL
jgi:hypothetical protein